MKDMQFDITPDELNPTFLFSGRLERTENENDYHNHDFLEMSIILEGKGTYRIDGQVVKVKEGDVLIFNPGIYHEAIVNGPDEQRVEYFIGFTDIAIKGMKKDQIELKDGSRVLSLQSKTKRDVFRICSQMEEENQDKRPGRYLMHRSYLIQLLLLLMRDLVEPVAKLSGCTFEYSGKKVVAEQIADYLEVHYPERITLDQIAENMYLSPFYISKLFKAEMGKSPIRYVIHLRMEHAKDLLVSQKKMSVSEVAAAVGYDDIYHFSKLFKKEYGIPPTKFRKN